MRAVSIPLLLLACLAHLDSLVAAGDVMVQPFVTSVAEAGEIGRAHV